MKENLFIRISYPWENVKLFIEKIGDRCTTVAVYQHDADEDVSRTHCHMVLKDIQVCRKQVLNIMKESLQLKGNADFATEKCDESAKPFIYMTKGTLDPVYLKGYSAEQALDWKNLWVEPSDQPKTQNELDVMYAELCETQWKSWKSLTTEAHQIVKRKRKYLDQHFFNLKKTLILTYVNDHVADLSVTPDEPLGVLIPNTHKWAEDMPEWMVAKPAQILELVSGNMIKM